jgi:hypothetical protein
MNFAFRHAMIVLGAGDIGVGIRLSNASFVAGSAAGTAIGTLSVVGGTGTYTFTLTNNAGGKAQVAGTNGVNLQAGSVAASAGQFSITVHADNGAGSTFDQTFTITASGAPVNTVLPVISGSTVVGQTLATTSGTWTGFPAPTFTYQWQRAAGVDAATTAWVSAVTGAGGTVSGTQQTRVDNLIKALKSGPTTGTNYFTLLDRLWLFAGESIHQQARCDVITATLGLTEVNSPTLSANGYTGNASTMSLDTGFNPGGGGVKYLRDSASMMFYAKTAADVNHCFMGSTDTSGGSYTLADDANGCEVNGTAFPGPSITQPGMWVLSRTGSAGFTDYHNAVAGSVRSSASNGIVNNKFHILASTDFTGAANSFSSDTVMMAAIGGGLTAAQAIELSNIINAYMTAWGVNTY